MPAFGLKNNAAKKLTVEQVLEIRRLYGEGYTQGSIGKHFGVSIGQIGRIVRGESWQSVEMRREATPAELDRLAGKLMAIQAQRLEEERLKGEGKIPPSPLDGGEPPEEGGGLGLSRLSAEAQELRKADGLVDELKGDKHD